MSEFALQIEHVSHRYGERLALDDVSLSIKPGEIFALLGPNGSGKTTLFRILCTLIRPSSGSVSIFGNDSVATRNTVRALIGVVFQSPSLDKQLTPEENLRHHGRLYGLRGEVLSRRIAQSLDAFGLAARSRELVSTLSGGLRRRVELAKGMLSDPRVLLLDEASTGLDPAARLDLWNQILKLRDQHGVTVVLTTHLLDEADRCDRVAILDAGKLLTCDSPETLKDRIGGDVITMSCDDPAAIQRLLRDRLGVEAAEVDGILRLERRHGHQFVPQIIEAARGGIVSISVGRPTLEDVFVHLTGRAFGDEHGSSLRSGSPASNAAGSAPAIP